MKKPRGAVAAGHPLTAQAAAEMLRAGGNAFDAAAAAFFTACAAEPVLASLGGGGFLLAAPAGGAPRVYDFFTHTPLARRPPARLDFEKVVVDFGSARQIFHIGYGAAAAPGAVAGILQAHTEHGRMPLREVAAPGVGAARAGVRVTATQAAVFGFVEPIYVSRRSARALFESPAAPGRVLREGEAMRFPQLADVVETLAAEGRDFFYRGEIASLIHRQLADCGRLTRDDLARYEVVLRKPLVRRCHGATLFTNPPPAAGGVLAAFGIALAERCRRPGDAFGDAATLLTMAGILQATREANVNAAATGAAEVDNRRLLDGALLDQYAAGIAGRAIARTGTTHISIVDAAGNAAALTVTNGAGCGEVLPGTGIMLNNMLGEEDVNPRGLHRWRTGERLSSMTAPTMIGSRGTLTVTGSGGSNRIRSALVQVTVNLVHHGMDVEQAVRAPRLHYDDNLYIESGFGDAATKALCGAWPGAVVFPDANFFFGGANTVQLDSAGRIHGCADPRRGGVFTVV